jgi:hypothetical protein
MLRSLTLFVTCLACAQGQWINHKTAGVPRTKNGKPDLSAPTPRSNGKPDFNGLWQTDKAAPGEIERMIPGISVLAVPGDDLTTFPKYLFNVLADYKPDEVTLSPEAAKILEARNPAPVVNPCLPDGIPLGELLPFPTRFVQTPGILVILTEAKNPPRQIHTDGRTHPIDPQSSWVGYSIGKWEGDTLVVDTMGITDKGTLDGMGHPISPDGHIIERLRRRDYGHMDVQVTIQDPKYYSKPISFKYTRTLIPDDDLLEWVCAENEKDFAHLK